MPYLHSDVRRYGAFMYEGMKEWILSEELLSRIEYVLRNEAVEVLRKEVKSGHITINGKLPVLNESDGDRTELFVIKRLIGERQTMREKYAAYLEKTSGKEHDAEGMREIQELRRFVDAVERLATLEGLAEVFNKWSESISDSMKGSMRDIIETTAYMNQDRLGALRLILIEKAFLESIWMEKEEMDLLKGVAGNSNGRA